MNHCYRLVFNKSSQVWQVVSEIAKSCGKSSGKSAAIVLLPLLSVLPNMNAWADPALNALPTGGQVTSGQSAITQNGNQLNIVQSTQQAIINWNSYNIGANAQVTYVQPNANAISLNRVTSGSPSEIFGKLNANGQVWLINPDGVLFGKNAQVNVGGIVATTLNIADDDFLNGKYKFTGNAGSVINMGNIVASNGGYVALLAPEVRNEGVISAMQGTVAMAAGNAITLDFNGNGLINVQVDSASVNTFVENKHLIQVGNGQVLMSTKAADGLITSVINNTGKIEANSMVNDGGVIRLTGAKTVINSGEISATSATQKGGTVHLLGDNVGMFNSSSVNVSGKTGGGTILVGGDFQGKNANIQNASKTFVDKDARLIADATESGNGGTVIVWANDITRYYGNVSAKGGAVSGNGGFAEVSGKRLLNFLGGADLSAANGVGGSLLLDPTNITLINASAANTTGFSPTAPVDTIEAFADDAGLNSIFNVAAGGSFAGIAAGSLIRLQATNDITVASAFDVATATGSANNRLTLEADNNINVNAALSITGNGTLRLIADSDNSGVGDINIRAAIDTDAGGAVLTGVNVIGNSAGNIVTAGATNANSGALRITATDSINLAGDITTDGVNVTGTNAGKNAGNVTLVAGKSVFVNNISASGSANNGGANGGNAGVISIMGTEAVNTGTLTTKAGSPNGAGLPGVEGSITLTGSSVVTLDIDTAPVTTGTGGNVNITTTGTGISSVASINASNLGAIAINNNDTLTINGVVQGTNTTVTKSGTGKLILAGNNTYSGVTTVQSGILSAANANALGATSSGTTVNSGAILDVNNVILDAEAITLNTNATLEATNAATVSGTVSAADNSKIGTTSAASTLTIGGVLTSASGNTLEIIGAGSVVATNALNNMDIVKITSAKDVTLRDVDSMRFSATASNLTGNLTATAANNITLQAGGPVTSTTGNILLTSDTFTNNAGANALTTSAGRWVVHTTNLAGNIFGGLNSGNQAIYGRALTVATPEAGNRYVFAQNPTLTITSTNQSKTYGEDATTVVASAFTANTFVDAAAFGNVFTQDTIANALTGSATSAGSPATSNVGAYAIDVTPISSTNGYTLTKSNAGNLMVNRANLIIAANNSTKAPDSVNPAFSSSYAGFVNGEDPSVLIGILDYATLANTSSPIGNYAVTPFGVTANNYSINFVAGILQVRSAAFNNISVFNNALTRPELFVETCQFNHTGSAMITGLDAFGLHDVDYEPALSQPSVGGVVANAITALPCTKI